MPSSRSSGTNSSSRSSKSSNSSNSSSKSMSMSKDNYYCLVLLGIIGILFYIYYYTYKSNREPFMSDRGSSSSDTPDLKASKGETVVALFYADWCPHCVAFKPDFMKAKKDLNGKTSNDKKLRLELVDCVANTTIASENNVSGFPTVKIFTDDNNSTEYEGARSYEGLTRYLK